MHGKASRRNCLTGDFDHARRKVNAQQIQVRPLRHEVARYIAGTTRGIQHSSGAWAE
jgi:hypothetical protein